MVSVVLLSKAMLATNALVNRLDEVAELRLVVCEKSKGSASNIFEKVARRVLLLRDPRALKEQVEQRLLVQQSRQLERRALEEIFGQHRRLSREPPIETIDHRDWTAVVPLLERTRPDVIVVFGTSLLPESVYGLSKIATLNIHPGLLPHYRGVNCTSFAILNDDLDNIGATVHFVRAGIDNGEIVLQRRPTITRLDNEISIDLKTQEIGHDLILEVLRHLGAGEPLHAVTQIRNAGTLFQRRAFTLHHRLLVRRLVREGIVDHYLDRRERGRLREKAIVESL